MTTEYLGMEPVDKLKSFSDKYYDEGDRTENGVIAKAILDYLENSVPLDEYKEEVKDLEERIDELEGKLQDIEDILC